MSRNLLAFVACSASFESIDLRIIKSFVMKIEGCCWSIHLALKMRISYEPRPLTFKKNYFSFHMKFIFHRLIFDCLFIDRKSVVFNACQVFKKKQSLNKNIKWNRLKRLRVHWFRRNQNWFRTMSFNRLSHYRTIIFQFGEWWRSSSESQTIIAQR